MQLSGRQKYFLRTWFLDGPFRAAAAPVYRLAVALELFAERTVDALTRTERGELRDLTVLIKTFERPRVLERLVSSIRRSYPDLPILVVDDSRNPSPLPGVTTIVLPHDSGLSAGRREGLSRVGTRFFLLLDDDFIFFRHTRLEPALALMERFSEIDIMGGEVVDLPFYITHDYREGFLYPTDASPVKPAGTLVGGLPAYDKVANFFLGRTDRVRMVNWDPELRLLEHADFFTRAKGTLLTVFNESLKILHARTLFDRAYSERRGDYAAAARILDKRYPRRLVEG
jgi:glycosyltransferase involved in cell wall biosynthesis